ncbi:hypothetical protein DAEQUDRAFT_37952 [Daedalea quercina L-15889]|uniref:Uncharacterized protein n=1 Tax=Daedalea quercina L-15889 TaxID=1314783 RepID=A0A165LFN9_9APHY|nr:hypothetical protein DAEQUDRAFT_37952 [Daedalea quercina L-15889]
MWLCTIMACPNSRSSRLPIDKEIAIRRIETQYSKVRAPSVRVQTPCYVQGATSSANSYRSATVSSAVWGAFYRGRVSLSRHPRPVIVSTTRVLLSDDSSQRSSSIVPSIAPSLDPRSRTAQPVCHPLTKFDPKLLFGRVHRGSIPLPDRGAFVRSSGWEWSVPAPSWRRTGPHLPGTSTGAPRR